MKIKLPSFKNDTSKIIFCTLSFSVFLILIQLLQYIVPLQGFGVRPRDFSFSGLFLSPFIHGSWSHLWGNLSVLIIILPLTIAFFKRKVLSAVFIIWLVSFFWIWLFGLPNSIHVGASGLVYGLIFFNLLASFFIRSWLSFTASIITFILFSSLLLSVLDIQSGVSFSAHLGGAIGGVLAAVLLRKKNTHTNHIGE